VGFNTVYGVKSVVSVTQLVKELKVVGDEAYIPNSKAKNSAIAYVAERRWNDLKAEFGVRRESAQVSPDSSLGLDSRKYGLNSGSAGLSIPLGAGLSLLSNLSRNERAPVVEELYANGPHIASGTFEIGSASLKKERSTNLDLGLQFVKPTFRLKVSTYRNRFNDYIYGQLSDSNGDGIPDRTDDAGVVENDALNPQNGELKRIEYKQTRALFKGIELEGQWRPTGSPVGVKGFIDIARGTLNGNISGNVPRMSPSRVSLSFDYTETIGAGIVNGYIQVLRTQNAARLALRESATSGYTLVNGEVNYKFHNSPNSPTLFIQGRNMLNQVVRLHTSYIKDVAPMPGRTVVLGLRGQL
jgi:iron complex outermembrane recepter protein